MPGSWSPWVGSSGACVPPSGGCRAHIPQFALVRLGDFIHSPARAPGDAGPRVPYCEGLGSASEGSVMQRGFPGERAGWFLPRGEQGQRQDFYQVS